MNPSDNLRTVQETYSAFAKGDIESILKVLSPNVVWGQPDNPYIPSSGTRHGIEGFLEWVRIGKESDDIQIFTPNQFISEGNTVVVIGFTKILARPTGKIYQTDFVHLLRFYNGKIIRFQEFFDTFAAAEAFRSK